MRRSFLSLIADHMRVALGDRYDLLTYARCAAAIGAVSRLGLAIKLPTIFGGPPRSLDNCMTILAWDPFQQHVLVTGFTRDIEEIKRVGLSLPEDDYPRQCVIVDRLTCNYDEQVQAKRRVFLADWLRDRCRLASAQHREHVIDELMKLGQAISKEVSEC